jgi:hypothetical protein
MIGTDSECHPLKCLSVEELDVQLAVHMWSLIMRGMLCEILLSILSSEIIR